MKNVFVMMLLCLSIAGYSQKIKVIEGDLSPLKGLKAINTEFTYDNMSVGKFPKEADYIAQKKTDLDKKEPGRGDKWEETWVSDRKERFEPQFRELFSKYSEMSTVDENSPYTLIFKTVKTEPGWNIGITRAPAFIDAEAWIVDTKDRNKVIAKITITKAPGRDAMGYDYETGARLQEAYAKSGKELGAFIKGKAK
ncbi:MAG: hypothetical protein C0490_07550 [Marivirga sp.]|nr:hypothetical protein [Marivirga sp.]